MSKLVPISGNKLCKILFLLPLLLPTANLFAQTPVGGFISTNTTWNLAGSPYIVTGQNIIVSSGVTLTIDAGVTVKFDSTRSIQIDGTLRAIGTAAQPILITSNTVSPQPGDWGFILFNSNSAAYNFSTGTGSILQYCTIEYAGGVTVSNNAALRLDNAIPYINNCTIRYNTKPGIKGWNYTKTLRIDSCTIQNNTVDTGSVTIRGASAAATAILTGCTITNNTSTLPSNNIYKVAGYFGNNLNNRIKNCTISNNNQYGIFIMSASNLKDTITGNSITNNTGNGIYYYYSLSIFNNFNNHTISNNTITGNTGNGIFFSFSFVFYSNTYTISNNIISKNQGSGIYYYSNPNNQNLTPNTLTIQKNKIVNNQSNKGAGIYIYTNNFTRVNPNITQNVIAGNKATQEGGGVYMDIQNETNNVFQYNSLINNYAPNSSAFWYKGAGVLQANKNTIVWNKTTGAAPTRAVYIGAYPASTNMTLNNNNIYNSHCNSPFYDFWFAGANSDSINARNTYWQQSTLTDVNNVIYDYLDTSTLGRVNFNPFLMLPDTSAPVTPVQNVTKTQAGSDVQLTWSANLETDIAGYKIYWGNPTGYSFSNVIDVGNVTSYALSGVSATDTIEVTAYDTQADITSTRTSAAAFLIIGSGVTYLMDNTPVTTNNGAFYDSGGPSGNYSNNENYTKTFTPVISGSMLQFTFTSFLVYGNDTLKIYDGPNTSYPVIGIFSGTTSPGIITATNPTGQITFQWTSNASTVSAGWAATISCIYPSTTCIISQPSDQIVSAGGSAIFNVGTGASVPLTYQWQVNTGSGWNNITSAGSNPAYFGWNTATLNLSGIVAGNNGYQYRCIVDNACTCGEQLSGNESWFKGDDPTVFVPIALSSNPSNATICAGQSITFTASGANTYQFFVNGVSQQGPSTSNTFTTSTLTSGQSVTVTGTNACGTATSSGITVTVNPLPTVMFAAFNNVCIDASPFTLTGGSPAGGVYSGTGVSSGVFSPSIAGVGAHTITYTYTNGNGCSNSASQNITVKSLPTVTLTSFSSKCVDASPFTITGGSPAGGVYSGTGVSGGVFTPSTAGAGTHAITYTYTDGNGCSNSASQNITVNALPIVTLAAFNNVCINASPFTLTGGSPAGGVYSGTGVNSGVFNPSTAGVGTHTITYTYSDINGCVNQATQTITVTSLPTVSFSALSPVCISTPVVALSGGFPTGGTYSGTGVSSGNFYPSIAGTGTHIITYTYTDGNNCSNSVAQNITVYYLPAQPTVTASGSITICQGGTVTLTSSTEVGATYQWLLNESNISGATDTIYVASAAGSYSVQATNICGSVVSDTVNITVSGNTAPNVTLPAFSDVCITALPFALSGGSPSGGIYSGTGVSSGVFYADSAGLGTFTITYFYIDSSGCSGTATQPLTVDSGIAVILPAFPDVCLNSPAYALSGGNPAGGVYSGAGVSNGIFNPAVAGVGSHVIAYSFTNTNGCTGYASNVITVKPLPTVSFTPVNPVCPNDPPFLLTQGIPAGGNYAGTGVFNNIFYPSLAGSGIHTVSYLYTDTTTGCSNTALQSITVLNTQAPSVTISGATEICDGESITLTVSAVGATAYLWSTGETTAAIIVSPQLTSVYSVIVTGYCGATSIAYTIVTVNKPPYINAGMDTTIYSGTTAFLHATGGVSYNWIPASGVSCASCASVSTSPLQTTTYIVTGTDENGCENSDSVTVFVDTEHSIYIANVFSPNNDGQNDVFFIQGKGIQTLNFKIYNRWGELVFETNDVSEGWDGTYKGQLLNPNVFVYYLNVAFYGDKKAVIQKGDISLVR